jgi:hypothetical protein
VTAQQDEVGVVTFLNTDETPAGCLINQIRNAPPTSCASYYVLRAYQLENHVDDSRFKAVALRYIPLIKTSQPGLNAFDWCLNSVCGDPDRIVRLGFLADARADLGWFANSGTDPHLQDLNHDYVRLGYRGGLLGVIDLLPTLPIDVWTAYTDLYPISGYGKQISEVQAQASVSFGPASLALSWRNGRREDTGQRDSTWKLMVGFKPKGS